MLSSKCAVCDSGELIFIKEQEAIELTTSLLVVKTPFEGIPILGNIIWRYKIAGNKFMPETHLRQLGFSIVLVDYLLKDKETKQRFTEIRDSRYIYQNGPEKTWFQHDIACEDFKDLPRRRASDKVLPDKPISIANW